MHIQKKEKRPIPHNVQPSDMGRAFFDYTLFYSTLPYVSITCFRLYGYNLSLLNQKHPEYRRNKGTQKTRNQQIYAIKLIFS